MDNVTTFVFYLTMHRVLVFACGIVSIVLGYRLLMRGLARGAGSEESVSQAIEAKLGNTRLVVKNLAPGSLFALFGALMVASMVLNAPPEITLKEVRNDRGATVVTLRGDEAHDVSNTTAVADIVVNDALRLLKSGEQGAAAAAAAKIIEASASAWNDLAWVVVSTHGNSELALRIAQAAVAADPASAEYLHTLAYVFNARGERDAALHTLRRAAQIDPRFAATLNAWEAEAPGR